MLGNCVLKKRTYISEDTPVTLACQEGRHCRKSTRRRGTSSRCKRGGEPLFFVLYLFTKRSCLWHSAWQQRIPVFYPVELLSLVGVAGRFPFLTRKGRGGYFPEFVTRLRPCWLKEPSKAPSGDRVWVRSKVLGSSSGGFHSSTVWWERGSIGEDVEVACSRALGTQISVWVPSSVRKGGT